MVPGEAALKVDVVRGTDRAVGRELDGAALYEGAGCHDDLAVVARHIIRIRSDEAVDRCGCLDALAERDHGLLGAEGDGLDDVVAGGVCTRVALEA